MNSITGFIGYFKLQDWWLNSFTQEERNHIEQIFHPLGLSSDDNSLIEGEVGETDETDAGLLSALSGWFNNKQDRNLAKKIIAKAYSEAITHNNILDLHFTLQMIIQIYYPDRDIDSEALNKTILACKEQIKIASGEPISGKNYYPTMHAIECRINAEDPYNNFRPSPGRITNLHVPGGHGVRVDSHVYAGYTIPSNYDSMIAKLITIAQTREEAINTMERALSEYVIEGVKTTIPFHIQLMKNEDFRKGNYTTKFLESFKLL